MGILVRMPVTGEVLGRRDDPAPGHTAVVGQSQGGSGYRIRGESARTDHAGRGVGIHVDGRGKVHVDAQASQLLAYVVACEQSILGQS